jgi:hypothetical protein
MPNKGNQGNRDQEETTTPTGTSGRRPGGNEEAQEWSNESTPTPSSVNTRRRYKQEDVDSGLGKRNSFR